MLLRSILVLTCGALPSAPAFAGVVTGRVMLGTTPVAGANLNFDPQSGGGGGVTELNDGTDAQGFFTTTVTPNNVYEMTIVPPPGSNALVKVVPNVTIGLVTNNLGTIQLDAGVLLSGRCVNTAGAGVAGVNIDVLDAQGNDVLLAGDTSDALGFFSLAVPSGAIEVRFDTTPVIGGLLAPRALNLDLSANHALGNVALQPGFVLSAVTRRQSNNLAVSGVDIDVVDVATDALLYTPGDKSNASGLVDVVVPAGTYDVRFEAPFALHLVGQELDNRVVGASTSLGTLLLQAGVVLSGTVAGFDGTLHGGVDVDVRNSSTGIGVYLGHDNTSTSGLYQVIVPTGTFDVTFSPPVAIPYGAQVLPGVVIAANKVQNGSLPSCPFHTTVGSGIAGSGGIVPQISSLGGAPRVGNSAYAVEVTQARGFAKAIVIYSLQTTPNPLPAPCAPFAPMNRRVFQLGGAPGVAGAGSGTYAFPFANDPLTAGHLFRAWIFVRDSAAPNGLSRTNELRATLCL
ncbi:MAG: hypothetical protein IT454_06700 [Planctomycetes bacterium]|nr:hypothetical protein [Planctomycetota bacterium]